MTCSRRKLLSRAQRQATIFQGAATAFATKGFAGTGMEEVAAASGISKEIVYRHFASKEELYRAVLDATVQTLEAEFARASHEFQSGAGMRARVRGVCTRRAHPCDQVGVTASRAHRSALPSLGGGSGGIAHVECGAHLARSRRPKPR